MPASCRGKPCSFKALAQILGQIICSGADKIGVLGLNDLSGTEIGGLADRWDGALTLTTAGMRPRRDGGGVGGGLRAIGAAKIVY